MLDGSGGAKLEWAGTAARQALLRKAAAAARTALGPIAIAFSPPVIAQDVVPPKVLVTTPGGINMSDGSIVYSQTDLSMGPLTLERYFRSGTKQPNNPMFGVAFSNNFDIYISKNVQVYGTADYAVVHTGDSASGTYVQQHYDPTVITPRELDAQKGRLIYTGSQFIYYDSAGTAYTFSATVTAPGALFAAQSRRVERIDFPDGRRQTFTYSGTNLKLVEDSSGYAIVFDYNANSDATAACIFKRSETYVSASSTCAGAAVKVAYGYSGTTLTSVTDVAGGITTYTANLACIKPPGFATCSVTQTAGGPSINPDPNVYASQTFADGGMWTVSGYDEAGPVIKTDPYEPIPFDGHLSVVAVDPTGRWTAASFTMTSPYAVNDGSGRTTQYRWTGGDPNGYRSYGSMLVEATYPEGDKYQAQYNGPLKSISLERHVPKGGGTPLEKLYSYQSCTVAPGTYQNCTKPIGIRDPAGSWTNYTYASHGGVLTEMAPAPAASLARPLKVTTWVQRYAWVKNSGGTLVQASLPMWVKNTETQCQTLAGATPAATCDPAAMQTVTAYEYGANGTGQSLLVKGVVVTAGGTSLRTCYGYDAFDRKISETQPNANLASCS